MKHTKRCLKSCLMQSLHWVWSLPGALTLSGDIQLLWPWEMQPCWHAPGERGVSPCSLVWVCLIINSCEVSQRRCVRRATGLHALYTSSHTLSHIIDTRTDKQSHTHTHTNAHTPLTQLSSTPFTNRYLEVSTSLNGSHLSCTYVVSWIFPNLLVECQ